MKIYTGRTTYLWEGGHATISTVGEWLSVGVPVLGKLEAVYLTAFFRHPATKTPNARHAAFARRYQALPKATSTRKGREVSLDFPINSMGGDAVEKLQSSRDLALFRIVAEEALNQLAHSLPKVVRVDQNRLRSFVRAKRSELTLICRKGSSLDRFITRLRAAEAKRGEVLRGVLQATWEDALLQLGFLGRAGSFRRTTVNAIEIVRIGRHPYFQAHFLVAPLTAGSRTNAELTKRIATQCGRAFVAGKKGPCMVTLADVVYPDDVVPPTEAGARAIAAEQIRAAKRRWLRSSRSSRARPMGR